VRTGVANSVALRAASIDLHETSFNIPGGAVEVEESGPTGVLMERATELIMTAMGVKTQEDKRRFIEVGIDMCRKKGLTACQTNDEDAINIYLQLERERSLPIRVFLTPVQKELKKLPDMKPRQSLLTSVETDVSEMASRLAWQRVKIFSDGSLGASTAALRVESSPGELTGLLTHNFDELQGMITESRSRGFRVEIHAIGDAAAEQVLRAMEAAEITAIERPVLTHCQVLGRDLIEKMRDLGVIANVQPSFVPTDMRWVQERLSSQKQLYAYGTYTFYQLPLYETINSCYF